ncbi:MULTISPECIES: hypothetical protein [unclassified Tolypothrix]|uniref:hypothetical protein n=1 Tax=unclassified Tolypothrix TaxID=2649714 RepID=UPI0005EAA8D3|nr:MULTISPECIES: hypothetical protein [unclassified Tolypothrix]BAY95738.1 hypothetical protein NIES3275_78150 [Microchaete diplosiphon NIES-3275]EKE97269.1 hypothetical protein FDUTEX481_05206 [Tolypothrix sp. PCC 7601]MBE9082288.1 hypothetical protein [Tolypothrix sp. LEGE 11397]UYD30766.1 hypothetical protein HGR01_38365 [Tolypothrix sp. PCC 7712]UYD38638.1 hypothetical protein HG267_39765 [Tolypothrix sp. PCC 7601]
MNLLKKFENRQIGIEEMSNSRKRTTIDLSVVGDRIEQLRHDSAWKALTLLKKVLVILVN